MAYIKSAAIVTRISEVLTDAAGLARTITLGTYSDDAPEGLDPMEDRRRALALPTVRAHVTNLARSAASPPSNGNFLIYDGTVVVTLTRIVATLEQLSETDRDAMEAASALDADIIRQAFEYPGNLTTTAAGTATDIASGMLLYEASEWRIDGLINDGAQSSIGTHRFTGKFFARP